MKVFVSYSHKDTAELEELRTHLRPFEAHLELELWSDQRLEAGDHIDSEIQAAIRAADVAILLVSATYLASEYVKEKELPSILLAKKQGELEIIIIYLTPSVAEDLAFELPGDAEKLRLVDFEGVNAPGMPASSLSNHQRASLFVQAARRVRDLVVAAKNDRRIPAVATAAESPGAKKRIETREETAPERPVSRGRSTRSIVHHLPAAVAFLGVAGVITPGLWWLGQPFSTALRTGSAVGVVAVLASWILAPRIAVVDVCRLQCRKSILAIAFRAVHLVSIVSRQMPRRWGPVWALAGVPVLLLAWSAADLRRSVPLASDRLLDLARFLNRDSFSPAAHLEVKTLCSDEELEQCHLLRLHPDVEALVLALHQLFPVTESEAATPDRHARRVESAIESLVRSRSTAGTPGALLTEAMCLKLMMRRYYRDRVPELLFRALRALLDYETRLHGLDRAGMDDRILEELSVLAQNLLAGAEVFCTDTHVRYQEWCRANSRPIRSKEELLDSAYERHLRIRENPRASPYSVSRARNNLADLLLSRLAGLRPAEHGSQPLAPNGNGDHWGDGERRLRDAKAELLRTIRIDANATFFVTIAQISALLAHATASRIDAGSHSAQDLGDVRNQLDDVIRFAHLAVSMGYNYDQFQKQPVAREMRLVLSYPVPSIRSPAGHRFATPEIDSMFRTARSELIRLRERK